MYIKQPTHLNWTMEPQVQIGDILHTNWVEVGEVKTHPKTPFLQPFINLALKITFTMIDTHKYDK